MRCVRIEGGAVIEVIEPMFDNDGNEVAVERRFHPDFVAALVDIGSNAEVSQGWSFIDGKFVPPVAPAAPSLADMKAAKLVELNTASQAIADQLTAGYPEFEKLTWNDQRREALAWQTDSSAPTPYIDALAAERGIERVDYLNRTLTKVTAFSTAAQRLVGQRQRYADQIKAAATPEQLKEIEINVTLK